MNQQQEINKQVTNSQNQLEEEKAAIEKIKEFLRRHGCKRSHLAEILSVYPTREIQAVVKSVLRKRKHPKAKSQLESWLETYFKNYYEKNGRFPPRRLVRETIAQHFPKIKLRNGKLPATKELLLNKIYSRLYMRLRREQKKADEIKD